MTSVAEGRFVKPEFAVTHFHIRKGDRVGDFGAGTGFFAQSLSAAVGNEGRVYAFEIQKNLVEALGNLKREENLSNLDILWCDIEVPHGIKINDGILDVGVMVNTLFQIENKQEALKEIARVIRKGGNFFLIDWSESFGGIGPHSDHVVSEDTAKQFTEEAGFTFERIFDVGTHHYGLAFKKV